MITILDTVHLIIEFVHKSIQNKFIESLLCVRHWSYQIDKDPEPALKNLGPIEKCIWFIELVSNAHCGPSALLIAILLPHDEFSTSGKSHLLRKPGCSLWK